MRLLWSVLTLLLLLTWSTCQGKILLVPQPWRSSMDPMLSLAREIQSRNHTVVFAVCQDLAKFVKAEGLELLLLPSCMDLNRNVESIRFQQRDSSSNSLNWRQFSDFLIRSPLPPSNFSAFLSPSKLSSPTSQSLQLTNAQTLARTLARYKARMLPELLRFCSDHTTSSSPSSPSSSPSPSPSSSSGSDSQTITDDSSQPEFELPPPGQLLLIVDRWALAGIEAAKRSNIDWLMLNLHSLRQLHQAHLLRPAASGAGGHLTSTSEALQAALSGIDLSEEDIIRILESDPTASSLSARFFERRFGDIEDASISATSDIVTNQGGSDSSSSHQNLLPPRFERGWEHMFHHHYPAFRYFLLDSLASQHAHLLALAASKGSPSNQSASLLDEAVSLISTSLSLSMSAPSSMSSSTMLNMEISATDEADPWNDLISQHKQSGKNSKNTNESQFDFLMHESNPSNSAAELKSLDDPIAWLRSSIENEVSATSASSKSSKKSDEASVTKLPRSWFEALGVRIPLSALLDSNLSSVTYAARHLGIEYQQFFLRHATRLLKLAEEVASSASQNPSKRSEFSFPPPPFYSTSSVFDSQFAPTFSAAQLARFQLPGCDLDDIFDAALIEFERNHASIAASTFSSSSSSSINAESSMSSMNSHSGSHSSSTSDREVPGSGTVSVSAPAPSPTSTAQSSAAHSTLSSASKGASASKRASPHTSVIQSAKIARALQASRQQRDRSSISNLIWGPIQYLRGWLIGSDANSSSPSNASSSSSKEPLISASDCATEATNLSSESLMSECLNSFSSAWPGSLDFLSTADIHDVSHDGHMTRSSKTNSNHDFREDDGTYDDGQESWWSWFWQSRVMRPSVEKMLSLWNRATHLLQRLKFRLQWLQARSENLTGFSDESTSTSDTSSTSSTNSVHVKDPIVLTATLFGIERPQSIPAHFQMVGTLLPPSLLSRANASSSCPQQPLTLTSGRWELERASKPLLRWLNACWRAGLRVLVVQLDEHAHWNSRQWLQLIQGLLHPTHALLIAVTPAQRALLPSRSLFPGAHVRFINAAPDQQIPLAAILRQPAVALLVCSGSLHEVQQAVIMTKPVLAIPSFAEQRDNVNRFFELGVALMVDGHQMESVMIAWSTHILVHNAGVRDRLVRLSLLLRSGLGTRGAANLIEVSYGLMRHTFSAASNITVGGAEMRERSVSIPSSFSYAAPTQLSQLPTLYRYNGYSFSLAPIVPSSPAAPQPAVNYEIPLQYGAAYDSAIVAANAHAQIPSATMQHIAQSMQTVALPVSLTDYLQSADRHWPWYRRCQLDVLTVCAFLLALISLALRACWSGCGAVWVALKSECAK